MLQITAHEPEEELLSGEDALKDAEESENRWQKWEEKLQKITPHEPEEELVSSVEEVFRDAEESARRWQEWERKHQRKFVSIGLPQSE